MLRKLLVLFIIISIPLIVCAQTTVLTKNIKTHKKTIVKETNLTNSLRKITLAPLPVKNNPAGDTIATTTYAYFTNSILRPQITFLNGVPQMCPMIFPSQEGNRAVTYIRPDNGVYAATELPMGTSSNKSGWGMIDVARTSSSYAGTIGIVAHSPDYLFLWDGSAFVKSPAFDPGPYPSFLFSGDNIFLASSGGNLQFKMYKSPDLGTTFTKFDSISHYNPTPIFWGGNGSAEVDMSKSPDEKNIVYEGSNFGTNGDKQGGSPVYNGISPDSADNVWLLHSTDAGTTWTPEVIAVDGVPNLVDNYPLANYSPLFENFGQVTTDVANDGVIHAVANGYGPTFADSANFLVYRGINAYPILYWNSTTKKWKPISSLAIDTLQILGQVYPSNAIGQSYPALAESEDGKVLLCTWTGPQITNGKVDTIRGKMYLDTYYAYSGDGGNNWTYGGVLNGKKNVAEIFCHPARQLEKTDQGYIAHLLYLENPPSSFINQEPFMSTDSIGPVCSLIYRKFNLTLTDVKDQNIIAKKFSLEQNYPNPFNPSTSIRYSIPENSFVTLKIFDMLGREVATLVNTDKSVGSYDVSFNASKMASGLYMYTLKAGNFTMTKKMMLLK